MAATSTPHRRTTVAIVHGTDGDPIAVLCDAAGDPPGQRWFTVVLDDADPDVEPDVPVCVDCLLEMHPQLGQGLEMAVEHNGAECDGGAWQSAPELWDD